MKRQHDRADRAGQGHGRADDRVAREHGDAAPHDHRGVGQREHAEHDVVAVVGLTRIRNTLSWQVTLACLLPPLIFMAFIFKDSRTHAYTYILPMLVIAGVGIDTLTGWLARVFGEKSSRVAVTAVLAVFLVLAYINYAVFIDQNPEYPWYPKRVLGMQFEGGRLTGTFGFPYLREWRQIGEWFQELPQDEAPVVVTNEKKSNL